MSKAKAEQEPEPPTLSEELEQLKLAIDDRGANAVVLHRLIDLWLESMAEGPTEG